MPSLTDLQDLDVLSSSVKITKTGDGLSKAMSIEGAELHHGQTVLVLLECTVIDVQTPQVKDTDGVQRKHVLEAGRATIVEGKAFDKALDDMSKKIEKAAGVQRIFDDNGEPAELADAD